MVSVGSISKHNAVQALDRVGSSASIAREIYIMRGLLWSKLYPLKQVLEF